MHQISDIVRDELYEFEGRIKYLLTYVHSEYSFLEIWVEDNQTDNVVNILQRMHGHVVKVEGMVNVEYLNIQT